ncbi:hypothetical protein pb186bvf_020673 [Paramecium bursaria]
MELFQLQSDRQIHQPPFQYQNLSPLKLIYIYKQVFLSAMVYKYQQFLQILQFHDFDGKDKKGAIKEALLKESTRADGRYNQMQKPQESTLKLFVFWNRPRQVEWFETHIYQAKRIKMVNYYGFKVAEKANEKNFRSVHRQVDHRCALFDASYHYVVNGLVDDGLQIIGGNSLVRFLNLYGYQYEGTKTFYFSILNNKEKIQSLPTYDKPNQYLLMIIMMIWI